MGLSALGAASDLSRPQPARIAVQWESGRVDFMEVRGRATDTQMIQLRELTRDLSGCSSSVVRAWLEDREGQLLYAAIDGHGLPRKAAESPMR